MAGLSTGAQAELLYTAQDQLEEDLDSGLTEKISGRLLDETPTQDRVATASLLAARYSGSYTQLWSAWVEVVQHLGVKTPTEWAGLTELGRTAHWFWAADEFAVMVERPTLLRTDSGGLIDDGARDTAYADGWGF